MRQASWLKYVYWAHFSRPLEHRALYRLVKKSRVSRIFELGIDDLRRTLNLIQVAQRYSTDRPVKYAAIDWFDTRPEELPRLTLLDVHRALQATSATVRLIPGEPINCLTNVANSHLGTDLILVTSAISPASLPALWPWMPRMMHATSRLIYAEKVTEKGIEYGELTLAEVSRRAGLPSANLAA